MGVCRNCASQETVSPSPPSKPPRCQSLSLAPIDVLLTKILPRPFIPTAVVRHMPPSERLRDQLPDLVPRPADGPEGHQRLRLLDPVAQPPEAGFIRAHPVRHASALHPGQHARDDGVGAAQRRDAEPVDAGRGTHGRQGGAGEELSGVTGVDDDRGEDAEGAGTSVCGDCLGVDAEGGGATGLGVEIVAGPRACVDSDGTAEHDEIGQGWPVVAGEETAG